MIVPHPEILLIIALVGLYLYDSTLLLSCNEGVLMPSRGGRWSVLLGSERFPVRGREPLLPNPFTPHRPLYRLSWKMEGPPGEQPAWTPPAEIYAPLAPLVWIMAGALFVLVPLGLFSRLGELGIAGGIVLFYSSALTALSWVWIRRDRYQCSTRRLLSLAVESLTCPPFALNIIRHLSLDRPVTEDLLGAGRRLLGAEPWGLAVNSLLTRMDNEIAWEDEGSARAQALLTHRQQLQQESLSCRPVNS